MTDLHMRHSNLILSDSTLLLMKQHLGFMTHLIHIDRLCMDIVFPRLQLLAISDDSNHTRLVFYEPMSLADIMDRRNVDRFMEPSFYYTVWNHALR